MGKFSLKGGEDFIKGHHKSLLDEVEQAIASIDSTQHQTKTSKEKTMVGHMLYNPRSLNAELRGFLKALHWAEHRIPCQYSTAYYTDDYVAPVSAGRRSDPFREMDFIKEKLGVEVQFGKYAFMVYNVCAKMTIFRNEGLIDAGIEVVPVKSFADRMSTGVSYFEQIVWDLEHRKEADIDVPVLVLGIGG